MKKNLIKKVFAVSLSIAMACSFLPAANPVTASAAAPYVSLKTTFKTLKVGQKYKMTLKNNTINWKIKKVETTDKTIATVYGKTTSQVMIKGKSEGRATIRVNVKTSKRKANNTKTLRCRVKVVPGTSVVTPTVQTDATVETQEQLDDALKNTNITKITISPKDAVNFVIGAGSYQNVDLVVNAPLSDIENSATFKSITINDIKSDSWTEKGSGNAFTILAKAAKLIVDKAASVRSVSIGTADSKVNLVVNGGTVGSVNVTAKTELNITGEAAADAALIPVTFGPSAADSVFVTELPVAVSMSASIELTFEKGAVKSTIKLEVANIKATVTNNTSEPIVITKNDGKTTQSIRAGAQKATAESVSTSTTPTYPGTSGGSTGGSSTSKPATPYQVVTRGSIDVVGTVTGSAATVSESSLRLSISGVTVTGAGLTSEQLNNANVTVSYEVRAKQTTSNISKTIASGDLEGYHNPHSLWINGVSINGFTMNEPIELYVSLYVKSTDQYAQSASVTSDPISVTFGGATESGGVTVSSVSGNGPLFQ